ncbi:2-methylcitrate dehydratase PrpD [Roseomonas rosea]|uniref:2-methylcitrate dehydratase PrpD n=1 Tax=Muricoccus roseus TaxID=198092 RepID=A0A1M6I0E7_9PROT|nr:MmgE/PrpD family protein [Roseomonas rosea]SHJ27943.1 2-methylcitrate dehydratase PrpD [Roseomonas rosea]
MSEPATVTLARHFASLTIGRIPQKHLDDAKALIADWFGVALAGSRADSGAIARRFAIETGGVAEATIVNGRGARVPAVHAAFANAIASHSVELDDVDILALYHFSPPVVAAALAAAERAGSTGAELLTAVVAGCEAMARLSDATNPSLRDRGYHTTPAVGGFGAAVAAGLLFKLDEERMVSALGLAGAQASGLMEMYGPSMQKRFNPGPAARNGVTSAVMAQLGFTGAATILDGQRGFCRAFSDKFDPEALTRGLGTEFPIYIEYKAYSCARPIHNGIDCALDIRRQMGADRVDGIRRITIRRHPAWAHYHQIPRPATHHEAQVSMNYSVAVALREGAALLPQYTEEKVHDPAIIRLSEMVTVVPDDGLPRGVSCLMTAEAADGSTYSSQVDHPKGSIANPMTPEEAAGKTHMLGDPVIGAAGVDRLLERIRRVETLPRAAELMELAQGSATGSHAAEETPFARAS